VMPIEYLRLKIDYGRRKKGGRMVDSEREAALSKVAGMIVKARRVVVFCHSRESAASM